MVISFRQNIVDVDRHDGCRRQIGSNGLRRGDRRLRAGEFSRKLIRLLQDLGIQAGNRLIEGLSASPDTADHLTTCFAVPGINIDQFLCALENAVKDLPGAVIVHRPNQDHDFRYDFPYSFAILIGNIPVLRILQRLQQFFQHLLILDILWDIACFDSEGVGIPFCQDHCLVFSQIRFNKVLAPEVFLLNQVAVAEDDPDRPVQCVKQAVKLRYNVSSGAAGPYQNDFDRAGF